MLSTLLSTLLNRYHRNKNCLSSQNLTRNLFGGIPRSRRKWKASDYCIWSSVKIYRYHFRNINRLFVCNPHFYLHS